MEGPTFAALAGCYTLWGLGLWAVAEIGYISWPLVALAVAFHSSLQHEMLHGHPTRSGPINEALVFPAIGLFIPYRRFRDLHLKHHNDERLTDPYDDPESFYLPINSWWRVRFPLCFLLLVNGTFAGRMIVGPWLAMIAFWWIEMRRLRRGESGVAGAWIRHLLGMIPVIAILAALEIPLWHYALMAAWPGLSLIMVRSYIEHRAAESVDHRTVVVESGWFWQLLFLNNNYHAVHHANPRAPWYRIPEIWAHERNDVLTGNGQYHFDGYGQIMRRWFFKRREPVVHPYVGHEGGPGQAAP